MDQVLEARGITKAFGPVVALAGVDLRVGPGEIVALAGENGSGKSTLAGILAGVLLPDAGEIWLGDRRLELGSPNDAIDAGIALVSQEPTAVPGLSIAENVLLHELRRPGRFFSRRDFAARARGPLAAVGLHVDPLLPFASLPQGQRELAEVARALATEPTVLILDEATTRLSDPDRLFTVVEALSATRGMATVVITHRLREIRRLCRRAVVLRDGRVAAELDADQLDDQTISAAMVGRELSDFFAKPTVDVGDAVLTVSGVTTARSSAPISLTVGRGEIVGLAGLVGSGRSELLEAIAGVGGRRAGAVTVDGRPVSPGSPSGAMKAGVALVPEDRWAQGLIGHHAVVANLALSGHRALRATRRRLDRRQAHETVARYGLKCRSIDAPVRTLSGGNAQKVVLARGVNQGPKVLLLDEPTRGVDIGAKAEIYAVIAEMVGQGVGVLVASSDLLELLGLCDRILVLHDGEPAGEVTRAEADEQKLAYLIAGGGKD